MSESEFTPEEIQTEEWRDVPGFEGHYRVSNLGRVQSIKPNRKHVMLKLIPSNNATRWRCIMTRPKHRARSLVHKVVLAAFVGPPPRSTEVNHIDGNSRNNRLANLEYVSHSENIAHSVALGIHASGERVNTAKLTAQQALAIYLDSRPSIIIAREAGIAKSTVCRIRRGEIWKQVTQSRG